MKPQPHEFFEILAREHAGMVYAFLRAAGHAHEVADDLLQESLLVAWRKIESFDRERPFGPWLRGIAAKLSLAQFRKRASGKETNLETEMLEHLQYRFSQLDRVAGFEFVEKVKVLRGCIEKLPEVDQGIVHQKYENGSQLRDIAVQLNLNVEVIKKRLQRARKKLKACVVRSLDLLSNGQLNEGAVNE